MSFSTYSIDNAGFDDDDDVQVASVKVKRFTNEFSAIIYSWGWEVSSFYDILLTFLDKVEEQIHFFKS